MKTIVILGATSSLGSEVANQLAKQGYSLVLVARDSKELDLLAHDLQIRYQGKVQTVVMDMLDKAFNAKKWVEKLPKFDSCFLFVGTMLEDVPAKDDALEHMCLVNYLRPVQILEQVAVILSKRKSASIVMLSSVAGDRGRASNYAYGAAKAALTAFASGIRNRFHKKGLHVMTVKAGFVDTPMTFGMDSGLIAGRSHVAKTIICAWKRKKDVVYVPFFWRYIMLVIKCLPEWIFKRTNL